VLGLLGLYWEQTEHKERLRPLPSSFSPLPTFLPHPIRSHGQISFTHWISFAADPVSHRPARAGAAAVLVPLTFALPAGRAGRGALLGGANCCPERAQGTLSSSPARRQPLSCSVPFSSCKMQIFNDFLGRSGGVRPFGRTERLSTVCLYSLVRISIWGQETEEKRASIWIWVLAADYNSLYAL